MSEDLIKRSDAIAELWDMTTEDCPNPGAAVGKCMEAIRHLPSADRPQGHYIKGENGERYCSNCKRIDDKYSVARFCWWCGAKMKGEDDEVR